MPSSLRTDFARLGGGVKMSRLKHVVATALLACLSVVGVSGTGHADSQSNYDRPGFVTIQKDGRLWVFKTGSKEYQEFQKRGEPSQQVTRVGVGPKGMTLKAPDGQTLDEYSAAK